jgi:hypothetical protein
MSGFLSRPIVPPPEPGKGYDALAAELREDTGG